MITIARFSKAEDAHLLRMRLEAGGIPAFVQDEHMVQMNWLYSNAIGGVRVQVADEHETQARELMNETGAPLPGAVEVECPYCHSHETGEDELPRRLAFLSMLLVSFPILFSRHRYYCRSCGRYWKERKRGSR